MCRHNQLYGCMLLSFGFGILVGTWLSNVFWCHCLGIGLMLFGLAVCRRK